jgi:hypothetical protein
MAFRELIFCKFLVKLVSLIFSTLACAIDSFSCHFASFWEQAL